MSWINVSEKLPERDQMCWVCISGKYVSLGFYDKDLQCWSWGDGGLIWDLNVVTHWEPFYTPELPNDV